MCMLFIKPKSLVLPDAYFNSLKEHNADGVSCYDLESGKLFQTLDYNEAKDYLNGSYDKNLVVHFRYGTSGKNTIKQLHGFSICNDEYVFFHNGVLSTYTGDIKKGLSDTQEFVNEVNAKKVPIDGVILFLEKFERSSRFLIVKKSDNSIIIPNCAKWNKPIKINDVSVQFSNTYAVDTHLLQDEGHTIEKPLYPDYARYYRQSSASWADEDLADFDNDLEIEATFAEQTLMDELENLLCFHTTKDVIDFITVNPEIATMLLQKE